MSLIDDMRRTVASAAGSAFEKGQQAAETVRLQAQLKKLQLERARRLHELGARTYDWYKGGGMVVSGPVPQDVTEACRKLEHTHMSLDETQRLLDEANAGAGTPNVIAGDVQATHTTSPLPNDNGSSTGPSDP